MESFTSDIDGYLVYKRKRKCTSSEESKPYPTEAISINSETSKAKADNHTPACAVEGDGPNVLVEFDKSGMEYHGGAAVSDAYVGGTMVQQSPKEVKDDKLLILREVLQKPMEESDKPIQARDNNNNEESDRMQQLDIVYTPSGLAQKEKYAKLRARQKERLVLRNKIKGALSSSIIVGPKHSSDLLMVKWKDAQRSSLMSLKGKDIIIPNTSLHKMNGSASGFTSGASFCKNVDPSTSRRSSGFLKRRTETNDWSELELDALWVGVRRHGQGNWETMLEDPGLRFFKNRTPEDLSTRWNKELLKISPFPKPTISLLPTISVRNGVSHSSPNALVAPRCPFSINLEPMVAELMFQTLYQKADLKMKTRPMRIEALQTPAVGVTVTRIRSPTHAEPNFLVGGYVQLPRAREDQNARSDHPIVNESNSSEEDTCRSEATLSY